MAARNIPWISPEEFLDEEERSETRHMYYDGTITAMAGGSLAHGTLAVICCPRFTLGLGGGGPRG